MINLPLIASKLSSCLIREYRPEDYGSCVDVYRSNMPDLLPEEILPTFEQFLQEGTSYVLVLEYDGSIIGTGSLELRADNDSAVLTFGIIHRAFHGRGFGSSLLAARLSLVAPDSWPTQVMMETSPFAGDFYAQYGFQFMQAKEGYKLAHDSSAGSSIPYAFWRLNLSESEVESLKVALTQQGVELRLENESSCEFQGKEPCD